MPKFSFVTIKVGYRGVNTQWFLSLFFMSLCPWGRAVTQRNDKCNLFCRFFLKSSLSDEKIDALVNHVKFENMRKNPATNPTAKLTGWPKEANTSF